MPDRNHSPSFVPLISTSRTEISIIISNKDGTPNNMTKKRPKKVTIKLAVLHPLDVTQKEKT